VGTNLGVKTNPQRCILNKGLSCKRVILGSLIEGKKMLLKILIVLMLGVIIYCLGSGLFFLIKDDADSSRTVKALTWRIALSFCLFGFLFFSYYMGWITPHGVGVPPTQ